MFQGVCIHAPTTTSQTSVTGMNTFQPRRMIWSYRKRGNVDRIQMNKVTMQAVLRHADFAQGKVSTRWVEQNFGEWHPDEASLEAFIAAALADVVFIGSQARPAVSNETDPFNPWKQTKNYRN